MGRAKGFTLIELLVVMLIIMMLASMLLVGINAVKIAANKGRCQAEIGNIMLAVAEYSNRLGTYPESGPRIDSGLISDASTGKVNHGQAWPASGWSSKDHPLVAFLTKDQLMEGGNRHFEALYPKGKVKDIADSGGTYKYLVDPYGNPYQYLADGRRATQDGKPSRVSRNQPILWSLGRNAKQDPTSGAAPNGTGNDQQDNNGDGKVDDQAEMVDDICSWW